MLQEALSFTYHDVTLYHSDISLLDEPFWINDKLISFYYDYLTFDIFDIYQDELLFIHPSTMFMIAFQKNQFELKEAVHGLRLDHRRWIFMPINDHEDTESVGGSHW